MDKHTKWEVSNTAGHETHGQSAVYDTVTGADIAIVYDGKRHARLIAASPRMLSALRLVAQLPGFEPSEPYGEAVLEAIKQATGH